MILWILAFIRVYNNDQNVLKDLFHYNVFQDYRNSTVVLNIQVFFLTGRNDMNVLLDNAKMEILNKIWDYNKENIKQSRYTKNGIW